MSDDDNREQREAWNGHSGRAWVTAQAVLDGLYAPLEAHLIAALGPPRPRRVLDVGCGTGSTTLAIARHLGDAGHVLGVDLSEPMIAAAHARAAESGSPARFLCADAQSHAFAAGDFDTLVSRFGVMFFADPVRAFRNLRQAVRADGELRMIVWRGSDENPFMTLGARAAAPYLPASPSPAPGAPGAFAFADPARVERLLADTGWRAEAPRRLDVTCTMTREDLLTYLTWIGPVGKALQQSDEATRTQVMGVLLEAFAPFVDGDQVRVVAACWDISARA